MWSVAAPRGAQMRREPMLSSAPRGPRSAQGPRDPAPTRMAYRYHRMMLRPLMRRLFTRILPALAVIGVLAAIALTPANRMRIAAQWAGLRSDVEMRPEFAVTALAVEGASEPVAAEIRELLALEFPTSRFQINLIELREALIDVPAVAAARLSVVSDGVLKVQVTERQPVAVWRSPEGLSLVDAEGVQVAWIDSRAARADLPLIAGNGAAYALDEARSLIAAMGPLAPRFRGLSRRGERRWDVVLDRDQVIMLPAKNPVAALDRVVALAQASDLLERDITALDMRVPYRPTLRLSTSAFENLRAMRTAAPQGE